MIDDVSKLSEADKNLRISEVRYRRLFESAQDGILLLNANSAQIEDVNPFLIEMLGYTREEFLGKKIWEIGAFKDTALKKDAFCELQTRRFIRYDNLPLVAKNGTQIAVEFVSNAYDCEGIEVIQCNIRDNTKRHLAELALRSTTRALKMLSDSNVALLGEKTEANLLFEYCRICVETGGYLMAWVGFADDDPVKDVKVIASFDHEDRLSGSSRLAWAGDIRADGASGRALRTGLIEIVEDISADVSMAPWQMDALKRGYWSTIAVPFGLPDSTMACLTLYGAKKNIWSAPERMLLQEMAADLAFGITALRNDILNIQYQTRLRESLEQTIQAISATIEMRDAYTAGHQRRVSELCSRIASELGLSDDRIHGLKLAASIHDLGKISIPAEILSCPRQLTVAEYALVKEHPMIGFNIIKGISFTWPIAQIILQHHERINGTGYPQRLTGDDILLEARILAVADIVEAMATHRPYRPALGIETALNEITLQRGISLDANVIDACLRVFQEQKFKF